MELAGSSNDTRGDRAGLSRWRARGATVGQRLLGNTMANIAGISMSALLQIVSMPVLTAAWGIEAYGVWLMLTTVPAYLALSDFGFVQAATNDMTMQVARGARANARRIFQSIWVLAWVSLLVVFGLTFLVTHIFQNVASVAWLDAHASVLFALVLYAGLALCTRVVLAGFRSTGNYARGALISDSLLLIEGLSILVVAMHGGGYLAAVTTLIGMRVAGMVAMYLALRRIVPWLWLGAAESSLKECRRLLAPALAAMTIPASLSLNLQGILLVVGAVLSPAAAAVFASVRTASRLVIQFIGAINRATMPEISAASATGRRFALARIVAVNVASVVFILVPGAMVFGIYGKPLVEVWSHGRISPDATFVALMALVMLAHGAWYYTSNMLLATNSHQMLAGTLLSTSVTSTLLAVPAAQQFGLRGVALVLLLNELTCLARVIYVVAAFEFLTMAELKSAVLRGARISQEKA